MHIKDKRRFIICLTLVFLLLAVSIYAIIHMLRASEPTKPIEGTVSTAEHSSYTAQWTASSQAVEIRNNYNVQLTLNPEEKSYTADLTIDVYNDSSDSWDSVYFRDYPSQFTDKENGRLSEITEIKDTLTNHDLELSRETDPTIFQIKLDKPLSAGETRTFSMRYKAYVPLLNARYGYQTIGESGQDFYLGNSLPILCPYDDGKFQYSPYFAVGECFYSRMANYNVSITAPNEYTVISTGSENASAKNEHTTTYQFTANAVRDVLFVIGNDYQVVSEDVEGIQVNSYYHTGREDKGLEALKVASDTLKDCNYRLGKYPYGQFSVVEAQMEMLGMEYPQIVLITMADEGVPSSVHEIMHQWFYSIVGSNSYTSAWLDESLATYLANPGLVGHSGYITQPYNAFASDPDYTLAMYFCGASMYNRLEAEYGKSTMTNLMRQILEQYAYKEISTQDLVNLLAEYFGADNEILKEYIEPQYLENVPE